MPGSQVPALVFGDGITGLAVLRSLGRNDVPVFMAGRNDALVSRSRWYRRAPGEALEETADGDRLASHLATLPFEKAVLFPCSDRWARAIAALPAEAAASYPAPLAAPSVLQVLVDKGLFASAVTRIGLAAPRTLEISQLDELSDAEIPYFFVKPRDSQPFTERFGVKAMRLSGRDQARELLRLVAHEGLDVLLQEFIDGPPTAHVFVDGYVDTAGSLRACLARRRLRSFPSEFGNSTLSITMPLSEAAEAVEGLRRLFEEISYRGLFDAEFVHDARDGQFKILEVNARPWWQLELAGACGLDLATMAYRDVLGLPVPDAPDYQVGRTWVHPLPDLRAWWAARGRGEGPSALPFPAWFRGANALFARDDPSPAVEEIFRVLRKGRRAWVKTGPFAPPP